MHLSLALPRPTGGLRPWLNLAALATLSCALLLLDDFLQQLYTSNNRAELELSYVIVLWLFSAALWLGNLRALTVGVLLLFAAMQLMQLANISFFGEPLSATDIQSLLNDPAEVSQTARHSLAQHWPALLCVALPYMALLALHVRLPGRVALPASRWALVLIALVLLAKPYRATYRNLDSFAASPNRSALHNSLNVFSAWSVRLAFRDGVELPPTPYAPYQLSGVPSTAKHVWLVVADSLRTDRLGLFGYERNTTPQLSGYLKQHPSAFVRPGIAAGVATDVSLPYLLNPIREPGKDQLLRTGQVNLFRFAQQAGFRTHWISSQESKLLAHLGSRYLDVSITREDHPLRFLQRQDRALLDVLDQQRWAERNFVVLNLRTAHLPYAQNYRHESRPMPWPDSGPDGQSNAYDNSIHYLDSLLGEVIADFDKLEGERYLIITGDHGQRLGEGGYWGHNDLVPEVSDVPMIVVARDAPGQAMSEFARERWISHYEAGKWLAARLGTRIDNPNLRADEYFVHGKLLFTDNFVQRVCETPGGLVHQAPEQLSMLLVKPVARGCAGDNG
ncbi:phosphoethanolamine transferase [Pseudomonas cremoricolorata]|uniref:phosphoethanolamine transferase n=1 Tax=Pseudomonas cremoricolorata TaxID=157783 RepID=UPI0003FC099E|nr:phosphoethanolamine transferase [Pseudomonas cremoricolorata]